MRFPIVLGLFAAVALNAFAQEEPTYAEKLGWPKGTKAVVVHVDDVGMSHSSNLGAIKTMKEGVATSCSIMMPCGWVSEYAHYLQKNPGPDAGLHLTMTSEWSEYRLDHCLWRHRCPQVCGFLLYQCGAE